jgi:2-Cys peroxiredoxin 5
MDAWARQIDPERKLRYISDGNLAFTRATGLISMEPDLFLGERSRRYAMILEWAVLKKIRIEKSVLNVTCTSAEGVLEFD